MAHRHRAHCIPSSDGSAQPPGETRAARRAWRRPRILERQHLEALAADCTVPGGKSDATCIFGFS